MLQDKGRRIGYIRESTLFHDVGGQLEGLELDRIFVDKVTRKKQFLGQFTAMRKFVREGDTLFVHGMDRLARNGEDFLAIVYDLTKRGVRIECVHENLVFPAGEDSPVRNLLLLTLTVFFEATRSWIRERHKEGRSNVEQSKGQSDDTR